MVPPERHYGHVLPQVLMLGDQSLPALTRTPDNRGNAYLEPSSRPDAEKQILPSFDCGNGGVKPATSTPPCTVQGPVGFGDLAQYYPNVREAGPGGVLP